MSRKRVAPEAQIIALFSGLSDETRSMVMFALNAMMAQSAPKVPKSPSPAPSAGKKSSRQKTLTEAIGASSATEKEIATSVGGSGD
jgi:hypothetical protein